MAFKVENPAKFWENGGDALGSLRWFADGDDIPDGWDPCDGGSYGPINDPKVKKVLRATNSDPAKGAVAVSGFFNWGASSSSGWDRMGRDFAICRGYVLHSRVSQTSGSWSMDRDMLFRNTNNTGQTEPLGSLIVNGRDLQVWGIFDGKFVGISFGSVATGSAVYGDLDPLTPGTPNPGNATNLTSKGTITGGYISPTAMTKFKGEFYAGGSGATGRTSYWKCDGVDWTVWTDIPDPADLDPTYKSPIDMISAVIDGEETLCLFTQSRRVLISTDGVNFTRAADLPGASVSIAQNGTRIVHDGEDTFWYVNRGISPMLWRSTDLQTWTPIENLGTLYGVSADDGVVAVQVPGLSSGPRCAYSIDKGQTWIETEGPALSGSSWSAEGIVANAAGCVFYYYASSTQGNAQTHVETQAHRPRQTPMVVGGVTHRQYMKVR